MLADSLENKNSRRKAGSSRVLDRYLYEAAPTVDLVPAAVTGQLSAGDQPAVWSPSTPGTPLMRMAPSASHPSYDYVVPIMQPLQSSYMFVPPQSYQANGAMKKANRKRRTPQKPISAKKRRTGLKAARGAKAVQQTAKQTHKRARGSTNTPQTKQLPRNKAANQITSSKKPRYIDIKTIVQTVRARRRQAMMQYLKRERENPTASLHERVSRKWIINV